MIGLIIKNEKLFYEILTALACQTVSIRQNDSIWSGKYEIRINFMQVNC